MKYEDPLIIGGKEFQSRLIVGTGKYPTLELMQECHEASGADMVSGRAAHGIAGHQQDAHGLH